MPNSSERAVVRQTRAAIEMTQRAAEELKRCVVQSRALVAESRALLSSPVRYRPGRFASEDQMMPPPDSDEAA